MRRHRLSLLVLVLLVALVACGGGPVETTQSEVPTAAPAASIAPTVASPPTATPGATATVPAPGAAPTSNVGRGPSSGPLPAAPSTAPAQPTATSPAGAAPAASVGPSALVPQPNGPIPPGWLVYRGPANFPFVIAYPPDWTVDASLFPEQQIIFIVGPTGGDYVERVDIEAAANQSGSNIDVQRDEFYHRKTDFCDQTGIEHTERRQITGVPFAMLGATCDSSNELTYLHVASGLKNNDEWSIVMRTRYEFKEPRIREIFDPMLASFNVYALLPR